ncbi:MAG TPA: response regulator transcription factor [Bryobacteraceae bacterium]|nr:response regulator transcription factor [Bryobacteraceae bacterium]
MISLVVYTTEPLNAMAFTSLVDSCPGEFRVSIVAELAALPKHVLAIKPDVILLSVDGLIDWGLLHTLQRESLSRVVLWLHEVAPESAFRAKECGVRGILRKSLPAEMILKCIRCVQEGELWFEKTLTDTFLSGRTVRVSRREQQLITLVSQGLKNKEIASVLEISEGTVKVYLSRLFEKVGVRDRFELALLGLKSASPAGDGHSDEPALKNVFVPASSLLSEPT